MAVFRYQGSFSNTQGVAIQGAQVYVCSQPVTTSLGPPPVIPPAPLATLFADPAGATPLANPVTVDPFGNFFFYATSAAYTLIFVDPQGRTATQVTPDIGVFSPGAGTVSSVAMTGDGVVLAPVVPGSPIAASGTLSPVAATAPANTVLAGPASGAPGPMTQRAPVAADLPAATALAQGAVQLAGDLGGTGTSPQVVSTHLAANLPINQGGRGNESDLGLLTGPPTFDCGGNSVFTMTLGANIASSSTLNPVAGEVYTFKITQDGTGGRTFAWPPGFHGALAVAPDAGLTTTQSFFYDGAAFWAVNPGLVMA